MVYTNNKIYDTSTVIKSMTGTYRRLEEIPESDCIIHMYIIHMYISNILHLSRSNTLVIQYSNLANTICDLTQNVD